MFSLLQIVILYTYVLFFSLNAACFVSERHLFDNKGRSPFPRPKTYPFQHVKAFYNQPSEPFKPETEGQFHHEAAYRNRNQPVKLVEGTHKLLNSVSEIKVPEDSFGWVAESKAFVDKSLFIKHFMLRMKHSVVLAPKYFGKTTILSMLRDFFEMPVNDSGVIQDNRTLPSFKTFQRLKIYQEEPLFFNRNFGNFTVLSMNFNELNMQSLQAFLPSFRRMVNRLFSAYPCLKNSAKLTDAEKNIFENHTSPHSTMSRDDLSSSGRRLTRLLHRHFRKKTIVLIDHIDAPAVNVMLNDTVIDADVEVIFNIIEKFVGKLIGNNCHVPRSLLTGITSVGNVYTGETANLVSRSVFEDPELSKYFGLTDIEFRELKNTYNNLDKMIDVRSKIGGYSVKGTWEKLYNTKSVLGFLENEKFEPETAPEITLLKPVFEYNMFGKALENSLPVHTLITLQRQFCKKDLYRFRSLIYSGVKEKEKEDIKKLEYMLFQYLFENGFYTIRHYSKNNAARVAVPNIEMKNKLERLIYTKKFFTDKFRIKESTFVDYMISIDRLSNNETSFQVLCSSVVKIFENEAPKKDFEFQGPLFVYPALCPEAFKEVYSEWHSDKQRADVFIRRNDGTIIVIELKIGSRQSEYEGLKQIVSNNYYVEKFDHPKNKVLIGLYVDRLGQCRISYLWNSDDFAHAKNVTLPVEDFEVHSKANSKDEVER